MVGWLEDIWKDGWKVYGRMDGRYMEDGWKVYGRMFVSRTMRGNIAKIRYQNKKGKRRGAAIKIAFASKDSGILCSNINSRGTIYILLIPNSSTM